MNSNLAYVKPYCGESGPVSGLDDWPVGVLFSSTGVTSIIEKTQLQGTLLAIEEVNAAGGVRGQRIRPIIYDPGSDPEKFGQLAEHLVRKDHVRIIFGCYMSSARRAVVPLAEQTDTLLCYPTFYEGFEYSKNVLYMGSVPNQTNLALAGFLMREYGKEICLVGSDYVYPRETNRLLRKIICDAGGRICDEKYFALNSAPLNFDLLMAQLKKRKPNVILSTVVGEDVGKLYSAYARAGFDAATMPIASLTTTESEIAGLAPEEVEGHISCGTYFASIDTPESKAFVARYKARFGETASPNMCAEASYTIVKVVSNALENTEDFSPQAIIGALYSSEFQTPQGLIKIDGENNHCYLWCRIAKIDKNKSFRVILEAVSSQKPDPYLVDLNPSQPLRQMGLFSYKRFSDHRGVIAES